MKTFVYPQCFRKGRLDRYYHYLYGYIFPFLQNVSPYDDRHFLFKTCGSLMDAFFFEIKALNVYKMSLVRFFKETEKPDVETIRFPFFDDHHIYNRIKPVVLRQRILKLFPSLTDSIVSDDVVIINRLPSDPYYKNGYKSGAKKRNIPNIIELSESLTKKNISHKIIAFERKSLFEQLQIFSSHRIFVGQHGAAFSHLPIAPRNTKVLEILSPQIFKRKHWSDLSALYGYQHKKILQKPDALSPINVELLTAEIEESLQS